MDVRVRRGPVPQPRSDLLHAWSVTRLAAPPRAGSARDPRAEMRGCPGDRRDLRGGLRADRGRAARSCCRPARVVVDAHTHLGLDEDGRSLDLESLLAALDEVGPDARACVFPLHDPERHPAYRMPNDRVLAWAARGRRPAGPVLPSRPARGAGRRGAALPRARGARDQAAPARAGVHVRRAAAPPTIFAVARDGGVPILIHAGPRARPRWTTSPTLALRFPEVPLVLAHAGDRRPGDVREPARATIRRSSTTPPASRRSTSLELFARVPAERIVFASDIPYGRPLTGAAPRPARRRLRGPRRRTSARSSSAARWRRSSTAGRCPAAPGPASAACDRVHGRLTRDAALPRDRVRRDDRRRTAARRRARSARISRSRARPAATPIRARPARRSRGSTRSWLRSSS